MALTRTPWRAYVSTKARVRPITPAFDDAYAIAALPISAPETDAVKTMLPPPSSSSGIACLLQRYAPVRLTSIVRCQVARSRVSSGTIVADAVSEKDAGVAVQHVEPSVLVAYSRKGDRHRVLVGDVTHSRRSTLSQRCRDLRRCLDLNVE